MRVYPFGLFLCNFSIDRTFRASESSGHGSGKELAGDVGQRGDHDRGVLPQGVPGPGQEEGGPDHHRL